MSWRRMLIAARNRFERQRGTDLAANGTDDQLGDLARRVSGIEVGVGAVRVEHVGVLTHLAADVGVQIERHPDRDVRADLLPEPAKEKAVGVGMVVGDGRAVQRGQHAVKWTVVAQRRHQLLDARVEGVRSERPRGVSIVITSGTTSTSGNSPAARKPDIVVLPRRGPPPPRRRPTGRCPRTLPHPSGRPRTCSPRERRRARRDAPSVSAFRRPASTVRRSKYETRVSDDDPRHGAASDPRESSNP